MAPFKWKNCNADVYTHSHARTVQSYLADVILPALSSLDDRIAEFGRSEEAFSAFQKSDMQSVLHHTKLAFALALQSIWERQFRSYLKGCANELHPQEPQNQIIESASWQQLCRKFEELRKIKIEEFPSFKTLDTLQILGNACRHGEGSSAKKLSQRCPELWPSSVSLPFGVALPLETSQPISTMNIPVDRLHSFVKAIAEFWQDVEYIYNESIEAKHPSLEARLSLERAERTWVPQEIGISGSEGI